MRYEEKLFSTPQIVNHSAFYIFDLLLLKRFSENAFFCILHVGESSPKVYLPAIVFHPSTSLCPILSDPETHLVGYVYCFEKMAWTFLCPFFDLSECFSYRAIDDNCIYGALYSFYPAPLLLLFDV